MASTPTKGACCNRLQAMSEKRWRSRQRSGISSLEKLLDSVHVQATYGDPEFLPINSRLCSFQQSELMLQINKERMRMF